MKRFHFTLMLILTFSVAYGQYNAGNGFRVSWSLDANEFPTLFPFTGLGAQSVLAGMDFDNDGVGDVIMGFDGQPPILYTRDESGFIGTDLPVEDGLSQMGMASRG